MINNDWWDSYCLKDNDLDKVKSEPTPYAKRPKEQNKMSKLRSDAIKDSLKDLNETGFIDDTAVEDIDILSDQGPTHPGEMFRQLIIEPHQLTIKDAARHSGLSTDTISRILKGKTSLTAEIVVRFELAFGNLSAEHWLNLQNTYDLWHVRQRISEMHIVPLGNKKGKKS